MDVVEAAIDRIETSELGVLAIETFDGVRAEAKRDHSAGPFAGAPMLLKDVGATCADARATMGSAFLKVVPPHDSELAGYR
ncbi:hypothetical protein [Nocardia brasiliensis]|uniref:hypothetical protein n=1 Tax=Nocardia brasiliensis TaxID=37326 RepID=UPI00366D9F37